MSRSGLPWQRCTLPDPVSVATRASSPAGVNVTRSFADFSSKLGGLENSTPIRSIRNLRNCGEIGIPAKPQESPFLALDLALGFGAEKLRLSWRVQYKQLRDRDGYAQQQLPEYGRFSGETR